MASTVNFDSGWVNASGDITGYSAYFQRRVSGTVTRSGANVVIAGSAQLRMSSQYAVYASDPINNSATSSLGSLLGGGQIKGSTGTTSLVGWSNARPFNAAFASSATSGWVSTTVSGGVTNGGTSTANWSGLDAPANFTGLTTPRTPLDKPNGLVAKIDETYTTNAPTLITVPIKDLCLNAVYSIRGYVEWFTPYDTVAELVVGPLQNNVPTGTRTLMEIYGGMGSSLSNQLLTQPYPVRVAVTAGGPGGPHQFFSYFSTVQGANNTGGSAGARMSSLGQVAVPMFRYTISAIHNNANYDDILVAASLYGAPIKRIYVEVRRVA